MSTDPLVVALVLAVALAVAAAVYQRTGTRDGAMPGTQAHRPTTIQAVLDLIDESIAAHTVRQVLGRSTMTRTERRAELARQAALETAEEIRRHRRFGVPTAAPPTHLVVAGTAASHDPDEILRRQAHPTGTASVVARSLDMRLGRSGAAAFAGLAAVLIVAIAVWPRSPTGAVLSATATPAVNAGTDATSAIPSAGSTQADPTFASPPAAGPSLSPTPSPTPTTSATPVTTTPRPTRTPRPTAGPTATPRPTPSPTPRPTPTPTATATPEVTPTPVPTPTPEVTPSPTPPP